MIRVGYHMTIEVAQPTHLFTLMSAQPRTAADVEWQKAAETLPNVPKRAFVDQHGNSCLRMVAPTGEFHHHAGRDRRGSGPARSCRSPGAGDAGRNICPTNALRYLSGQPLLNEDGPALWEPGMAPVRRRRAGVGACPGDLRTHVHLAARLLIRLCPRHPDRDRNP